jgi:AcrR family transcriptional regulator
LRRAKPTRPETIPPAGSRRTPLQDRSRQRVERILDAAAQVFGERGYDAATTEEIARIAGTSIGSVYQFFPNKLAIFNAISLRYLDRARALFDTFVTPESIAMPWPELIDRGIDAFAEFHEGEPGFRAILLNWRVSAELLLANDAVNRELAHRAEAILVAQAPGLTPRRRALVATMIIEIVSSMLILGVRRGPEESRALLGETKMLLRRYLEPIVSEHGAVTVTEARRSSGTRSSSRGSRSRAPSSGTRSRRR